MKKLYFIFVGILLSTPLVIFAQFEYKNPLVKIAGFEGGEGLGAYVNFIYGLSISLAALLAVIKIVIAGAKWMLSDIVTDKASAKNDIKGALFGLILIISAVLILTVINPDIVG